ncbi:MAG: OsmC family protein [Chloroflexota bacterium]
MKVSALVENSKDQHQAKVTTNGQTQRIGIQPKSTGFGSAANGAELLCLALATCYCNDIYREAAQRGITVKQVEVEVIGDFDAPGEPGKNISYEAKVIAEAGTVDIEALMRDTDRVAEIHNMLRVLTPVTLTRVEAISTLE